MIELRCAVAPLRPADARCFPISNSSSGAARSPAKWRSCEANSLEYRELGGSEHPRGQIVLEIQCADELACLTRGTQSRIERAFRGPIRPHCGPRGIVLDHALAGPHRGVEHGLDELGRRQRRISQCHLDAARLMLCLGGDARLVVHEKYEQAPIRPCVLERDPRERLDELSPAPSHSTPCL